MANELRRGFKTESERIAVEARKLAGIAQRSPLPARLLAAALNVTVVGPLDIPGMPEEVASSLLVQHSGTWSAFTFKCEELSFIVHNTTHCPTRQESNLMHELAHIWCRHRPDRIEPAGRLPWATRTFNPEQEAEAAWLGGCLQAPREALLWFIQRRFDNAAIAAHFGASVEMIQFRRSTTGIDRQLQRAFHYRSAGFR